MSTLQHKQVKSQKEHLKILGAGGPRGRGAEGPRTKGRHMGPRAEKNKYPKNSKKNAYKSKQMPGGQLSRLTETKFNFHM